VRQLRAMLHRACRLARKWSNNRLPNPVADTELPDWKLDEQPVAQRAPSVAEVRALLDAAWEEDLRVGVFIRVVAASGARRSEVCALRWSDIDWDTGSVVVDEATVADDGGVRIKGPKTRASVRPVAVDAGTLADLRVLRAEREEIAAECDVVLDPRGFVFAAEPSGLQPPHPDGMSHAFSRVRERAGVASDIHLHSLRHFQSTELDPVISEAQKQARMGGPPCTWPGTTPIRLLKRTRRQLLISVPSLVVPSTPVGCRFADRLSALLAPSLLTRSRLLDHGPAE
jgi:integrase